MSSPLSSSSNSSADTSRISPSGPISQQTGKSGKTEDGRTVQAADLNSFKKEVVTKLSHLRTSIDDLTSESTISPEEFKNLQKRMDTLNEISKSVDKILAQARSFPGKK